MEQPRDAAVFLPTRQRRRRVLPLATTGVVAALWLVIATQPVGTTGVKFAALTLVLGIGGRYIYVKLSPNRSDLELASGWVFALALAFAFALEPVKSFVTEPDLDSGATLARSYGLVPAGQEVTAVDRCTARQLRNDETSPSSAPATMTASETRSFYRRSCRQAQAESLLLVSGIVLDRNRFAQIEQAELERLQSAATPG